MISTVLALALSTALPCSSTQDDASVPPARFPESTALAEGISPDGLAALSQLVQSFVTDDEVVGAELLVIKNGRTILHEAYGWCDREAEAPLTTGSVFCVRSMTKPVIGAAIQMLLEDNLLELDDHVAQFLPAFDAPGLRDITVEHLLTHTSGLPMSFIAAANLYELEGIRAVADLAGARELLFEPGSAFSYSDQGTDTLTALIEVVTGAPAADFIRARVLEPLGMRDSVCVMAEDHPLRARAVSKYAGTTGQWRRFWSPNERPLFPFFLGSQGLYSTLDDYAGFLDLWLHKGRAGQARLLRASSVRRALTPGPFPLGAPSGFPGLQGDYGALMQLWTAAQGDGAEDADADREVVAFGHTGSDGTHAWAFPKQRALVLYFTQSRGTLTGLRVEEQLGELILGVPFDPLEAAPPLEQYLGYYREDEGDLYRAIVRDGDDLALEILGKAVVPLTYIGDDRWKLRPQPATVLSFDRAETGEVTGYHIGGHQEFRFEPSADLPNIDDVAARVRAAHGIDRLEALGALRLTSRITIEKLGLEGESVGWFASQGRWRHDERLGEGWENVACDGARTWSASNTSPRAELEGARADELRQDSLRVRFGDWTGASPAARVIQRIQREDEDALLVRLGDTSSAATTLYIDNSTSLVGRIDSMATVPGMGRIGRRMSFRDYRDVSGLQLPHGTSIQLANPLIGDIRVTLEAAEIGIEIPEGLFALKD